uniref:G-protein coupled receptors family 1 profile domain-containing protein n=1 Tax=Wuchereria bancrofti TaxID=6293 RepID=A0AAF5Q0Y3_WUCBA
MATVCYSRNNLYGRPFIFIVSQIVISNLVTLIPYVIILLPGMLLSENYAYIAWMNDAFCKVRAYSTVVMVYFSFLLTLNRFVVIVLPKCNVFFQSTKLYFLLLLVWLISFVTSFADFYFCTRHFEVSTLRCLTDGTKHPGRKFFKHFLIILLLSLAITMIIMYLAIICNIRRRSVSVNNETRKTFAVKTGPKTCTLRTAKYERSMLIQAGLNSGGLIFGILIFHVLPAAKVFGQEGLIAMDIFYCCYTVFYHYTLPTAFFLTNGSARIYLHLLLNTNVVKPILILTKQVTR